LSFGAEQTVGTGGTKFSYGNYGRPMPTRDTKLLLNAPLN
jgi:hypothetical protein